MKKVERLELENQVLKNAIACALENIEIGKRLEKEEYIILAEVKGVLDIEDRMNFALENERSIDYRMNAKTLQQCQSGFEKFGNRVILNDGMVVGFEY